MHGLQEIIAMNNRPAVKAESNHNRHCSFAGNVRMGIVLHSAKLRNTVFLNPSRASIFLDRWMTQRSVAAQDALVESYF